MKRDEVFPSKYLKAEEATFANGDVTVTIKDVVKEEMQGGKGSDKAKEEKPVMYFKELSKGLVMNKTNWGVCEALLGSDDSDDWQGERVILTVIETVAYGEAVKGIRIKDQKPVLDKSKVIAAYQKMYERGVKVELDGIENYVIDPNMPVDEIMQIGKELRHKVEAAEAFA